MEDRAGRDKAGRAQIGLLDQVNLVRSSGGSMRMNDFGHALLDLLVLLQVTCPFCVC